MEAGTAHDRYMELLLDKVRADRYPSGQIMDRIEAGLARREHAETYLALLVEKTEDSQYPSHQMLDRIERLSARMS